MNDHGKEQETGEQTPRRGIQLVTDEHDLTESEDQSGYRVYSKPVSFGSIGMGYLSMSRYKKEEDMTDKPAVTLDEEGKVINGSEKEFWRKGYYETYLMADSHAQEGVQSNIGNLWVKDGPVLSNDFYNDGSGFFVWGGSGNNYDLPFLYLPMKPELLKELRVSFEGEKEGVKQQEI